MQVVKERGIEAKAIERRGDPADGHRPGEEQDAELIVVGTRACAAKRWLMGSVSTRRAARALQRARRPVLGIDEHRKTVEADDRDGLTGPLPPRDAPPTARRRSDLALQVQRRDDDHLLAR